MLREYREELEAYIQNPPVPLHASAIIFRQRQKNTHKTLQPISAENQQRVNRAAALWVARNNRPNGTVVDSGLMDFFVLTTADICGIDIKLPGRTEMRTELRNAGAQLRNQLKERALEECDHYSLMTDIWTDRPGRSYTSLTLHYLTYAFVSRNWALEVTEFSGKHTGDAIAESLGGLLESWDLEKTRCAKLLRDAAANAIKASKNLGVPHMSCIAHSLHLVVSGVLVNKKGEKTSAQLLAEADTENDDNIMEGELFVEQLDKVLLLETKREGLEAMEDVRDAVQRFRTIATYLHRSSKGLSCLRKLQSSNSFKQLAVKIDCPTRWNSCHEMLARMVELRLTIVKFFEHIDTDPIAPGPGHADFSDVSLAKPSDADWYLIECLLLPLEPFLVATEWLSGETYATLSMTYHVLHALKVHVANPDIFAVDSPKNLAKRAVDDVKRTMGRVQASFLELLDTRFKTTEEWMYISLLNPRTSRAAWAKSPAFDTAKKLLVQAAVEVAKGTSASQAVNAGYYSTDQSPYSTPQKKPKTVRASIHEFMYGAPPKRSASERSGSISVLAALPVKCEMLVGQTWIQVLFDGEGGEEVAWLRCHIGSVRPCILYRTKYGGHQTLFTEVRACPRLGVYLREPRQNGKSRSGPRIRGFFHSVHICLGESTYWFAFTLATHSPPAQLVVVLSSV